jgi:hypothetical protein
MAPYTASIVTQHPPYSSYKVWSRWERRWVTLTFDEYQAWLARPDLDPVRYAPRDAALRTLQEESVGCKLRRIGPRLSGARPLGSLLQHPASWLRTKGPSRLPPKLRVITDACTWATCAKEAEVGES